MSVFSLNEMIAVARSLGPVKDTEYARGICELIGRLMLDVGGFGEGTGENAAIIAGQVVMHSTMTEPRAKPKVEPMFKPEPTAYPDFRVKLTLTVEQLSCVRRAFDFLDSDRGGLSVDDFAVIAKLNNLAKGVAEWKLVNGVK